MSLVTTKFVIASHDPSVPPLVEPYSVTLAGWRRFVSCRLALKLTSPTMFEVNVGVCTNGTFCLYVSLSSTSAMSAVTELLSAADMPTFSESEVRSGRYILPSVSRPPSAPTVRMFQPHQHPESIVGSSLHTTFLILIEPNFDGSFSFATSSTSFGSTTILIRPDTPCRPTYTETVSPCWRCAFVYPTLKSFVATVVQRLASIVSNSLSLVLATLFVAICTRMRALLSACSQSYEIIPRPVPRFVPSANTYPSMSGERMDAAVPTGVRFAERRTHPLVFAFAPVPVTAFVIHADVNTQFVIPRSFVYGSSHPGTYCVMPLLE